MILLIVDDETPTRTGLQSAIDWQALGITRILEAADGEEGLRIARREHPDIILSDVRMPRMDGIAMLEKVRAVLPETVFVFMSGFSDKDYLKAAIRLGAVSYVEKPLNFQEVETVIAEAVRRSKRLAEEREAINAVGAARLRELALYFTAADSPAASRQDLAYFEKYGSADDFSCAATVLLWLDQRYDLPAGFLRTLENDFHERLTLSHFHFIAAEKQPYLFVFHLFRRERFTEAMLRSAAESLRTVLPAPEHAYIITGEIVNGIRDLYRSYSAAVIAMQQAFFLTPGTVLSGSDEAAPARRRGEGAQPSYEQAAARLAAAWSSENKEQAEEALGALYDSLLADPKKMIRSVRALYFRLTGELARVRSEKRLRPQEASAALPEADAIGSCFSLKETHTLLCSLSAAFFDDLRSHTTERSVIDVIRNYIAQHYTDPLLSTKEISEHAGLSASYACTVFKNETGQTLNQFITEYRMERAKALLRDPRSHITGIAQLVGYNDGNYFGKAFKKYTGLSPSEYREKNI